MPRQLALAMVLTLGLGASAALAQPEPQPTHPAGEHAVPAGHQYGAAEEGEAADSHGEHGDPTVDDINWATGFIGESDEAEPGLLWRPTGTPPPLGALLINTGVVFYLLYRFGKKPLREGLAKRRANLLRGIEEANQMREKARGRLAEYEEKLAHMDQEIERLRQELRENAQAERERVLSEARTRGERLERDARLTIQQELKAAGDELLASSVRQAVARARQLMTQQVSVVDQQRFLDDYLGNVAEGRMGGLS